LEKDEGNMDNKIKILVVDDDEDILDAMHLILNNVNQFESHIETAKDAKSAMAEMEKDEYDVVLSDYKMPNMNGIDLLTWVKDNHPKTARILITGYPSIETVKDAINKANIDYFVEKPWDSNELKSSINVVLKRNPNIGPITRPIISDSIATQEMGEKLESEKGTLVKINPPLNDECELELGDIIGVDNSREALKLLSRFEKKISAQKTQKSPKQTLMFEFTSISEFNKFSFEMEKMENTRIKEVRIFENKYIISVSVYPSTYHFVS
jgi:response regulator RpfG family c-di-GMP phosphodiesterase